MSQAIATTTLRFRDPEREPLLSSSEQSTEQKKTPLPKLQLSVALLLLAAERISSQVIVPFINELVGDLGITGGDPKKVGYYVGLLGSLFYAARAASIISWSHLSDRIGRKPVLLAGLVGMGMSLASFGFSKTFWGLMVSRCAAGLLNGNISVIKSIFGDITDPSNRPAAFAFNQIVWATGGTIGSFAGGVLARPADRFPSIFDSPFWRSYPYLLSCLFGVFFAAFCFSSALTFLEETIKPQRTTHADHVTVSDNAIEDDSSIRSLMTPPVIISVTNYCVTAFLDVCLFPLFPLFYATPIELGGLGFDPLRIAICLSAYGILNGIAQILFFAKIIERFGPRSLILAGTVIYPFVLALSPLMNLLCRQNGASAAVWGLLVVQLLITVGFDMSFGAIFLFVTASSPNKRTLGGVNGIAHAAVAMTRVLGPATSDSLFALSLERNWLGGNAVYVTLAILPLISFFFASRLPPQPWVHVN